MVMTVRYLIYCRGGYQRTSAGSAVLNKLCHYLNEAGYEAYMSSTALNPEWNTKSAPRELQEQIARSGSVVYPEVQRGNVLNAAQVIRYVLNVPGLLGGDRTYNPNEKVFVYIQWLGRFVPDPKWTLCLPVVDTRYFNRLHLPAERNLRCFYVGKGRDKHRIAALEKGAIEITRQWPEDHATLAEIFKAAQVFITYDDFTNLIGEARLCGCPVIIIEGRKEICTGADSLGLAWNVDEYDRAKNEVELFTEHYQENIVKQWPAQFQQFIEVTQSERQAA